MMKTRMIRTELAAPVNTVRIKAGMNTDVITVPTTHHQAAWIAKANLAREHTDNDLVHSLLTSTQHANRCSL